MIRDQDARFPINVTWAEAMDLASSTLAQRREGLRLMLRVSAPLVIGALATVLYRHALEARGLGPVIALAILAASISVATFLTILVSATAWRRRAFRWHLAAMDSTTLDEPARLGVDPSPLRTSQAR